MRVTESTSTVTLHVAGNGSGYDAEQEGRRAWSLIQARWPDARIESILKVIYPMSDAPPFAVLKVAGVASQDLLTYLKDQ